MPSSELHDLDITEAARLIQARKLSPVELAEHMLRRIESLDARLHAYAVVTAEVALEQARSADAEIAANRYRGPLHGIPIGLKDLHYTKGIPTAAGMALYRDFRPAFDGTVVRRLREAGTVLLGKLQLTEGAFADHHPSVVPPVNPWGPELWSGASSSGSGVAMAAGLALGATGTDTGGSIRFPCAANGVTGLKPTWGRVSRHGAFELAASLDHIGPMCRSAADCGAMLAAMAGPDPDDPTAVHLPVPDYLAGDARDLRGVRIGVDDHWNAADVDAPTTRALVDAERVLRSLGADMRRVQAPHCSSVVADWSPHCAVETAVAHEATYPSRRDAYGPGLAGLIDLARGVSTADFQKMLLRRRDYAGRLEGLFQDIDLLLVPAQNAAALTIARKEALVQSPEALAALLRYTAPFDMSGSPTITLPGGFTPQGAPVAFQLVSRHFAEDLLVRAGRAFQHETDWHQRHPAP
jgi:amidase